MKRKTFKPDYIDFEEERSALLDRGYEEGMLAPIDGSVVEHASCEHCESANVYGVAFRRLVDESWGKVQTSYIAYLVCRECEYASEF